MHPFRAWPWLLLLSLPSAEGQELCSTCAAAEFQVQIQTLHSANGVPSPTGERHHRERHAGRHYARSLGRGPMSETEVASVVQARERGKVVSAREAVRLIRSGDTIAT